MAIIKSNAIENVLANITIYEYTNSDTGALLMRELIAHTGYAIYDTTEELAVNPETGETYPPVYSYQVICSPTSNYTRYRAVPITGDMEVVGQPVTPDTEVMSQPNTEETE